MQNLVKKKMKDKGQKCAKMQDNPAKSGTVGKYIYELVTSMPVHIYMYMYMLLCY